MVSVELVRERIERELHCEHLEVVDTSTGCGSSFEVIIVSPDFAGTPLLQRHRRINALFQAELTTQIHALSLKTWTPEQYRQQLSGSSTKQI